MSITPPPETARQDELPPAARRIPPDVLAALTPAQRERLILAVTPHPGTHRFDLRASIPLLGRRYYITLLAGPERRSQDRLAREGQLDPGRVALIYAALAAAVMAPLLVVLIASAAVSRLAGIDGIEPPLLALQEMLHRQ